MKQTVYSLLTLMLILFGASLKAQINSDAYREYLLVGNFGELCTMCEATLLCAEEDTPPANEAVPTAGSFTLIHLQTRTFWSQISTIWEWFVANFDSDSLAARGHTRPATIYKVIYGRWHTPQNIEARLTLEPALIEFGDFSINREDRSWLSDNSQQLGYCERLPLWGSLDTIERMRGGTS